MGNYLLDARVTAVVRRPEVRHQIAELLLLHGRPLVHCERRQFTARGTTSKKKKKKEIDANTDEFVQILEASLFELEVLAALEGSVLKQRLQENWPLRLLRRLKPAQVRGRTSHNEEGTEIGTDTDIVTARSHHPPLPETLSRVPHLLAEHSVP
jgi:hypothetical protein